MDEKKQRNYCTGEYPEYWQQVGVKKTIQYPQGRRYYEFVIDLITSLASGKGKNKILAELINGGAGNILCQKMISLRYLLLS